MSIQSVTKMWSRNGGGTTLSENGKERTLSIREAYQVVCEPSDGIITVLSSTSLPRDGSLYPGLPFVVCRGKSPTQVSPVLWIVEANFEGKVGPNDEQDNPLNAPPEISWSDVETDEPTDEDIDGAPIVTVNGEPIEGITIKLADNVVTIKRNFLFFNPFATSAYRHSVNSDSFLGYPPGTARLTKFSAKNVAATQLLPNGYWEVTATIQFRRGIRTTDAKAWYKRVRHEGFYEKVGSTIVRAVDDNKEPVTRPVLLKSDGTRETNPANAHWLEFKVYNELPYQALGLI
jgi:hypothetical protein